MADISKEDLRKEIAAILKDADLASTSAKKVRKELEDKLDADLQSRKKEIDDLVMEFVSAKDKKKGAAKDASEEDEDEEEEEEEEEDSEEDKKTKKRGSAAKKPPAKKSKKAADDSEASEQSEAESEEEYSPKKATKPVKGRKLPPKKKKGGSDSDSDEDWQGSKKKGGGKKGGGAKRGGGGYTKAMKLSPELASLVGEDSMARHEVVKKVWSIIKEKDLYDPKNKQFAICDDALFKVIGVKRFRTFGMMKYLKTHFIS